MPAPSRRRSATRTPSAPAVRLAPPDPYSHRDHELIGHQVEDVASGATGQLMAVMDATKPTHQGLTTVRLAYIRLASGIELETAAPASWAFKRTWIPRSARHARLPESASSTCPPGSPPPSVSTGPRSRLKKRGCSPPSRPERPTMIHRVPLFVLLVLERDGHVLL